MLETAIVVAADHEGNIKGAWSHVSWFIGGATVSTEDAYKAVSR